MNGANEPFPCRVDVPVPQLTPGRLNLTLVLPRPARNPLGQSAAPPVFTVLPVGLRSDDRRANRETEWKVWVSRTRWDLEHPVLESARHSPGDEPFSAQPENTRSTLLVSARAVILNVVHGTC